MDGSTWEGVTPGVGEGAERRGGCEIDGLEGALDWCVTWAWEDAEQPDGIRGGQGGIEIPARKRSTDRLFHGAVCYECR